MTTTNQAKVVINSSLGFDTAEVQLKNANLTVNDKHTGETKTYNYLSCTLRGKEFFTKSQKLRKAKLALAKETLNSLAQALNDKTPLEQLKQSYQHVSFTAFEQTEAQGQLTSLTNCPFSDELVSINY